MDGLFFIVIIFGIFWLLHFVSELFDSYSRSKNDKQTIAKTENKKPEKKKWDPDAKYSGKTHCWVSSSRFRDGYTVDESYIEFMEELEKSQKNKKGVLGISTKKPY